jgi:hypothetical protein
MLYILGDRVDRSAQPARVTAELYRAHAIENYDTAALRCTTTSGAELLFVVSHATADRSGPIFSCEFERATVDFVDKPGGTIVARFTDGTTKFYGSPSENRFDKLWAAMQSARDNTPTVCGVEAALGHTRCSFAAQQSMPDIRPFPGSLVRIDGQPGARKTWIDGLDSVLQRCYTEFKTPSELGLPWAARGNEIVLDAWDFDDPRT